MSKENVKLFYQALAKDPALQQKFKTISRKYEGQKTNQAQADMILQKELLPLAKQAGYKFTLAELKNYARETSGPSIHELSEDELRAVSGGFGGSCVNTGNDTCGCSFGMLSGLFPET